LPGELSGQQTFIVEVRLWWSIKHKLSTKAHKKSRTLAGAALYVLDGLKLNKANGFFSTFK
jgi:hypothetical protein